VASLACCAQIMQPKEVERSLGKGTYMIDTRTILQSLDEGADVFTPQETPPEVTPKVLPVKWSQEDYFRVAQALHESVWQEPLDSLHLNALLFRLDCEDTSFGPQFMALDLFRVSQSREMDSRVERHLYIEPWLNQVEWSEVEYYPAQFNQLALDLTLVRVSAEEALAIAESNGGQEARLGAENECEISGSIAPSVRDGDWRVSYLSERRTTLFEINIDEQSGNYEVVSLESK